MLGLWVRKERNALKLNSLGTVQRGLTDLRRGPHGKVLSDNHAAADSSATAVLAERVSESVRRRNDPRAWLLRRSPAERCEPRAEPQDSLDPPFLSFHLPPAAIDLKQERG